MTNNVFRGMLNLTQPSCAMSYISMHYCEYEANTAPLVFAKDKDKDIYCNATC